MQCVEALLLGQCQEGVQGALPLDALAGQGTLLGLVSGDGLQQSRSLCGHMLDMQRFCEHLNNGIPPCEAWQRPLPSLMLDTNLEQQVVIRV